MSTTVKQEKDIPDSYAYVLANDTFLSGWGPAEGKINVVILPCDNEDECEIVTKNARSRSDMQRVRVVYNKPKIRPGKLYSLMDRKSAKPWYTESAF